MNKRFFDKEGHEIDYTGIHHRRNKIVEIKKYCPICVKITNFKEQ